jgi:hypothetical protein
MVLDDGSIWSIDAADQSTVTGWSNGDSLTIGKWRVYAAGAYLVRRGFARQIAKIFAGSRKSSDPSPTSTGTFRIRRGCSGLSSGALRRTALDDEATRLSSLTVLRDRIRAMVATGHAFACRPRA